MDNTQMDHEPELRPTARAILVDPDRRILMMHFRFPSGVEFWATPGGALEGDETHEAALIRELEEECGLSGLTPQAEVWTREHVFQLRGKWFRQQERFYFFEVEPFELSPTFDEAALAAEGIVGYRWWRIDELRASGEDFAPRRLADLLEDLLRELPSAPIDAGI